MSDTLDTSHAPVLKFSRSSNSVKEMGTGFISITRHSDTAIEFFKSQTKTKASRTLHPDRTFPPSLPYSSNSRIARRHGPSHRLGYESYCLTNRANHLPSIFQNRRSIDERRNTLPSTSSADKAQSSAHSKRDGGGFLTMYFVRLACYTLRLRGAQFRQSVVVQ